MRDLESDNSATFHFIEGSIDSEPGPGVRGFYDGPYYSFYKFPRTFEDSDDSILEAYEMLEEVIEEEGPFDGAIGFSHGGTLISGFLIHHAKTRPYDPPPLRCAIFFSSLPPFRMEPGGKPQIDPGLDGYLNIPTVSVVGTNDFVYESSLALHNLCNPNISSLVTHTSGHDIPRDPANISAISRTVRRMLTEAAYAW